MADIEEGCVRDLYKKHKGKEQGLLPNWKENLSG
jgi:hypothetical protein